MKNALTTLLLLVSMPVVATVPVPVSIADVAQRGLPLQIETTVVDSEVDVPLLTADGNILHLLGTAHSRVLTNTPFVEVSADLKGVTLPDCVAHVENLVDAATHHSLAQKLKMTCLGQDVHDVFMGGVP